jgi:hypothetical protein
LHLKKTQIIVAAASLVWLLVVGAGIKLLWEFSLDPGIETAPPIQWPAASLIPRATDRATLVMLAHPHCPCTRASINELAVLMTRCRGKVDAYVAFYRPAGFASDWTETDLWASAAEIPGVSVLRDDEGVVARSFNAATSGKVLLYDEQGVLRFSGGITAARGHAGDNSGRGAIVAFLIERKSSGSEGPVFGCPLFDQPCVEGVPECSK